jgi:hypothetical protein
MFKLPADERLHRWRIFRKSLDTQTLDEAVIATVQLWSHCPFAPYHLDIDKPETWPDPWTLITENWYCDIAKALGMLYTIKYTKHDPEVELRVYHDPATNYDYNLAWIDDGKYVLNMEDDEVVNKTQIDKDWELRRSFQSKDLKIDNY